MKACIYCRVACDNGFGLEMQRKALLSFANQSGYIINGIYTEYGSGLTLERPGLKKVTEALLTGQAETLIVMSMDRIGRIWNETERYINLLTEHGIKVLCAKEGYLFSKHIAYDC